MKKEFIFTAMLAGVLTFGFSQTAFMVRNAATWIEAVNGVRNGGNDQEYTITVTSTVSVPASLESTFGPVSGITVTITGGGTLTTSSNGFLLAIGPGQTIVATDAILRGRDNNNAPVIAILREGIFRMEGKASVTGNKTGANGGGVYVAGGAFTMQDSASISGNTSFGDDGGGGVYVAGGTFIMQGSATVSGNTAGHGGGVYTKEHSP
jgi:predicted outer membrane repeat protein